MLDQILQLQPLLVFELLALGTVTGFLAGLLGIGGGMLMVPFLSWILASKGFSPDITVKMAVATSLATICFTSLSSVRAHHNKQAVLWPVALAFTPGILLGAAIGAQFAAAIPAKLLSIFFALFLASMATQMFMNKKPKAARALPQTAGMVGVGGVIGVMSSMLGAGGAFLSVPFMTRCNVPMHKAVGTSAALGFPIALAGSLGYVWAGQQLTNVPPGSVGYLYIPALLVISLASVSTAPLGAHVSHKIDVAPLKKTFAISLYVLAASMLWR